MDHRIPLGAQTKLSLAGMDCEIETVVGRGSNAIVYKGRYRDRLSRSLYHEVLIKELFPLHPQKKIFRNEQGDITVLDDAAEFYEMHRRSFEVGNEIHLRLLAEHPNELGGNLNSCSCGGTLYTVLEYSGGRSLEEELKRGSGDLRAETERMLRILEALEAFHKSGYLHLDLSPDNIMLLGQAERERAFLIDYNSALPVHAVSQVYTSFKAGYSSPEAEIGDTRALQYASDLYSAAAVFFRMLMGRPLTLEERLQARAPDGKESPYLQDVPQTVCSMVSRILRKGLHTLPQRRYQSIEDMQAAFRELLDRIDCVGVTHWSLWENGRKSVENLVKTNPSLDYITKEAALYPIRLERGREQLSLAGYLSELTTKEHPSGLILADGGMGKTTLLLHTALLQGRTYAPARSAVFYLSLQGWKPGEAHFILTQILLRLRFRKDQNTMDSAFHALVTLLQKPLKTKTGTAPVVLLLLDGLNEIGGNSDPLLREINELTQYPGVRILAASRTPVPQLQLEQVRLLPLQSEDLQKILGREGLLVPRNEAMLQLLQTPLTLSIYMEASRGSSQLEVQTQEELIRAYLQRLYEKEAEQLPEYSPVRWQLEAAMYYVLPFFAAAGRGKSLTEAATLRIVERCWKVLRSKTMLRVFPQWIGHSRDILGDCRTAEQWYGCVVHQLLWQRLGLLRKDPDTGYLVFHQIVSKYLEAEALKLQKKLRRKRLARGSTAVLVPLCTILLGVLLLLPDSYDDLQAEQAMDRLIGGYSAYGQRISELQSLTEYLMEGELLEFKRWNEHYQSAPDAADVIFEDETAALEEIDALCASGDRVSWSHSAYDGEAAKNMYTQMSEQVDQYEVYLEDLVSWSESEKAQERYPDFPEKLAELVQADAKVRSKQYYDCQQPHMEQAPPEWKETVEKLLAGVPEAGAEPAEKLEALRRQALELTGELERMAAAIRLIAKEKMT